ncbi:MAG: hypothetical protein WBD10_13685 [Acidobacteriaceae bacterium]
MRFGRLKGGFFAAGRVLRCAQYDVPFAFVQKSYVDPENKGLSKFDPENKGVSRIDPENKRVSSISPVGPSFGATKPQMRFGRIKGGFFAALNMTFRGFVQKKCIDPENKWVRKFDPENKGVSSLILKTQGIG